MGLPRVVASFGVDPAALLGEMSITPDMFDDPDNTVALSTVGRLFRRAVELTNCQHLGLLVGQELSLSCLGAVGFLMKSSATVGEALAAVQQHLGVQDRGAVVYADVEPRFTTLGYTILVPGVHATEQIHSLTLLLANNLMRELCGNQWRAEEVLCNFAVHDPNVYRRAFEAPIRFSAERCGLVFSTRYLDFPVSTADSLLHRMMSQRIAALEANASITLVDAARQLLATMALLPNCTAAMLASRLGMTERTLYRRLGEAGVSFQSLLDDACCRTATELLARSDKRPVEVAAILGYSDASAFTRAFQRWTGMTPAAWKASQRAQTA
jgi:AraC-like DNA-binding protein